MRDPLGQKFLPSGAGYLARHSHGFQVVNPPFPHKDIASQAMPEAAENTRKTLEERGQMSDIDRLRHSSAHVMATAILRLWPEARVA